MPLLRVVDGRGFSLIEAILASALLVVGVLALVQVFSVATRATATASHVTFASMLAAQKLEELRSLPWGVPADGTDRVDQYARRWSVVPLMGAAERAIVITVDVAPGDVRLATVRARKVP